MNGWSLYALQPTVVRIGRASRRLGVMDLSSPSQRQQLYHRRGSPPSSPPGRKRQRQTAKLWKAWEPIKRRRPSPPGSWIFRHKCSVFFLKYFSLFFCFDTYLHAVFQSNWSVLLLIFVVLSSVHSAGKSFFFFALPAKHGIVSLPLCLKARTICSCLCGDRMAPSGHGRCQSPWQRPNYRHGKRLCQTAPQAQPLHDCPTSGSMQKAELYCR